MLINIAHRGARSLAPENTLLAAQRAYEIGADLWETDVAVTADYHLILMHDDNLRRTTDVDQRFPRQKRKGVERFTLDQIRRLDVGSWFIEQDPFGQIAANALSADQLAACRGQKVPLLKEALILTKELDWRVNLELKPLSVRLKCVDIVSKVLALIDQLEMAKDQVIISSFHHPWLREIRSRRPAFPIQALIGDVTGASMNWGNFEFDTYNADHHLIDESQIQIAHQKGKKINIFTVNTTDDMRRYDRLGIAGLFTDFPQRLKSLGEVLRTNP